jgi:acid stress-induced BolA-like protein IbaG/YrbA
MTKTILSEIQAKLNNTFLSKNKSAIVTSDDPNLRHITITIKEAHLTINPAELVKLHQTVYKELHEYLEKDIIHAVKINTTTE